MCLLRKVKLLKTSWYRKEKFPLTSWDAHQIWIYFAQALIKNTSVTLHLASIYFWNIFLEGWRILSPCSSRFHIYSLITICSVNGICHIFFYEEIYLQVQGTCLLVVRSQILNPSSLSCFVLLAFWINWKVGKCHTWKWSWATPHSLLRDIS